MKKSSDTDLTLDFYAREAPDYAASGPGGASRHLHRFLINVPIGGKILDLGCGGGRDSAEMIRLDFDVVPTDGVAEMARQAEQRVGKPVRIMRFDELDYVDEFDAVWAHASLLHVPRHAMSCVLGLVLRALKPGGHHFASYKSGSKEGRDRFDRYFNYYAPRQLVETYKQSGPWKILKTEAYVGGGYDDRQGPWVGLTARKPR